MSNYLLSDEERQETLKQLNERADNKNDEEWGYLSISYFISNKGRVYNKCTDTDIIASHNQATQAHLFFYLHHQGEPKKMYVHQGVYSCFGDKEIEINLVIHHISLSPTDNRIENLYLMPRDKHAKLHRALQTGKLQLTDVDTAAKLDAWLLNN